MASWESQRKPAERQEKANASGAPISLTSPIRSGPGPENCCEHWKGCVCTCERVTLGNGAFTVQMENPRSHTQAHASLTQIPHLCVYMSKYENVSQVYTPK